MFESLLTIITIVSMIATLFLIIIPVVPVTALEWTIAMIFGALTGFERFTPLAAVIATIFMALGSTSGFWLPLLGLKGKAISLTGIAALFVGMLVGSFLIPIPIIGTILGGVIGVMLAEFARIREFTTAVHSGKMALRVLIYSMVAEFFFAAAIVGTVMLSFAATAAG